MRGDGVESGVAMSGSLRDIFGLTSRSEPRRASASFLAPLLVLALFVCHGAFGGADHRTVLELMPSAGSDALQAAGGLTGSHPTDHPVERSADRPGPHVDYVVAALFAVLCASLLRRLFGLWRTSRSMVSPIVRSPALAVPSLSVSPGRAPTAPEVQVFRL